MIKEIEIRLPVQLASESAAIKAELGKALGVHQEEVRDFKLLRRSLDARQRKAFYVLRLLVAVGEDLPADKPFERQLRDVIKAPPVIVVGFGPAGIFAALRLIELGYRPLVLERGKAVRERRFDIAALNKRGIVDPDSNYCFGEGGAGTFSDGKLYTRSDKRGAMQRVLQTLVAYGASRDILIDAHPHIGSNKLPRVVTNLRRAIEQCGAEVMFSVKVARFEVSSGKMCAVITADGRRLEAKAVILATGHSARDIFYALHDQGIELAAKQFAVGVRVEHPQTAIDRIQYRANAGNLPPASYSFVERCGGKGVYSFCMCPGGIICPSATAAEQVVVNGWSPSKRNSYYANSGMVTEVDTEELSRLGYHGVLAGVEFQEDLERRTSIAGGGWQKAPAQRLTDFIAGKPSDSVNRTSYRPGTTAGHLREVLPEPIHQRLREGIGAIAAKARGYLTDQATVLAVESRTSSPVRIPRDPQSRMHPAVAGLFPCGEGAGYAGGISSAAMDGENSAEAAAAYLAAS